MTQTKDSATKVASRPTTVASRPTTVPTTVVSRTTTAASHGTTVPNPRPTTVTSHGTTVASQVAKVPSPGATTVAARTTKVSNPQATTVPGSQVDHVNDDIIDRHHRPIHHPRPILIPITFVNTGTSTLHLKVTQDEIEKKIVLPTKYNITYKLKPEVKFNYIVTHFVHKIKHTDDDATMQVKGPTRIEVSASVPK